MKRGLFIFGLVFVVVAISSLTSAASCLSMNAQNTQNFLSEISSLNSQLSSCAITIPNAAYRLIGDGNILVSVSMNDGSTEQFYATISNQVLSGLALGAPQSYSYEILLSEATLNSILSSSDVFNEILVAVQNNDIVVRGSSLWGRVKWFFAQFFLPSPGPSTAGTAGEGKPDYCDETYLPGHQGYSENQALWDSYSADTDNVCQSQYGRGIPSPCVHTVQLSVSGNPYYLCWYNE